MSCSLRTSSSEVVSQSEGTALLLILDLVANENGANNKITKAFKSGRNFKLTFLIVLTSEVAFNNESQKREKDFPRTYTGFHVLL